MARKKKNAPVVEEITEVIDNEKEVTSEISGITLTLEPEPFDAAEFYSAKEENSQPAVSEDQPLNIEPENAEPVIHDYTAEDQPVIVEPDVIQPLDQDVFVQPEITEPADIDSLIHEYNAEENFDAGLNEEGEPELTAEDIIEDILYSDNPEEVSAENAHQFIENSEDLQERAEEVIASQPEETMEAEESPVKTKDYDAEAIREETQQEKNMTKHVELKRVKRKKKKNDEMKLGFNWFFWISFIIILIPCVYFVMLLLDASDKTSTPLVGERPEYDLRYVFEYSHIQQINTAVRGIEGIEKVYVNLAVESLRVTIDTKDDLTNEQVKAITEQAYEKVNEILPVETYFTIYQTYKQYDLQIDVYNNIEFEGEQFIYYSLWRNSNMEEYTIKDMNAPLNPELYNELLEEMAEERRQKEEEANQQNSESSEGEESGNTEESGD
ncbi:MAG: hypothetical protein IJM15_05375 [Erysipelotrichaceae bacterium]|nr:hypothetical protein [Erysipelotrichaceae bacterium]